MFFTGPAEFGGISSGKTSVAPDGIPGGRAIRSLRKHSAVFVAISAVLLGAAKPVHILTPSATVRRIVNMTALTVADANAAR